ncbi:MAG: efflux RND transporter periplasmic adaptor subunit [Pyrinomonadaceae bacterium]
MTDKTSIENDNETNAQEPEGHTENGHSRGGWILLIGGAIVGIGLVAVTVALLFGGFGGNAGRPVSAPRNTDFGPAQPADTSKQILSLTADQVQSAGVQVESVGEQLSSEAANTSAAGTVEANAYRQTPVVALAGGIVRRVVPELGSTVRAGQTLAVVFSNEFAQTQSRYLSLRTETENARRRYERAIRLAAINQPDRAELEQAVRQRSTAQAALAESRSRYERTTKLLKIGAASREELEQDTAKLQTAEAELEEARRREERASKLLPISSEVRTANEEAMNQLRISEAELAAVRQRLILFGMSTQRVDRLTASQITSELAIPAPSSGTITSRSVNVGEVIEANKELLRVTDLSSVWVIAQVYERDIARLHTGSAATINVEAFPERVFRGQIVYIDPQIDETSRTAKVRIEVGNPGDILKIGMFVRVSLSGLQAGERTIPVVPASAVQTIDGRQIVFVATDDPNAFELRPVRLGSETDGRTSVIEGLSQGEKVVTTGSFMLRAEWLKTRQGQPDHH